MASLLEKFWGKAMRWMGVEMVKGGPRDYVRLMEPELRRAKEVRTVMDGDEVFVACLPGDFVPETWREVSRMRNEILKVDALGEAGIEVVAPPEGTPEEISKGWVGLRVPFAHGLDVPPVVMNTPELRRMGMTSETGYVVSSPVAVAILAMTSPEVAEEYKRLRPRWEEEVMVFNSGSSRVVRMEDESEGRT